MKSKEIRGLFIAAASLAAAFFLGSTMIACAQQPYYGYQAQDTEGSVTTGRPTQSSGYPSGGAQLAALQPYPGSQVLQGTVPAACPGIVGLYRSSGFSETPRINLVINGDDGRGNLYGFLSGDEPRTANNTSTFGKSIAANLNGCSLTLQFLKPSAPGLPLRHYNLVFANGRLTGCLEMPGRYNRCDIVWTKQ
jgi:hypothetical protein